MTAEDRLRAGVIGLGWAGQQHMTAYTNAADVDLVALAGMETETLQRSAVAYGIPEEHTYADWRDLIDHEQLDLLSIAAPTTLHAPIAIAALDAGMHVLSEKPMAENAGSDMSYRSRRADGIGPPLWVAPEVGTSSDRSQRRSSITSPRGLSWRSGIRTVCCGGR